MLCCTFTFFRKHHYNFWIDSLHFCVSSPLHLFVFRNYRVMVQLPFKNCPFSAFAECNQLCSSIAITTLFNQSINFAFLPLCIFASLETIVLHCNCRLKIVSFQAFPEFAECCNQLRSSISISFLSRGF